MTLQFGIFLSFYFKIRVEISFGIFLLFFKKLVYFCHLSLRMVYFCHFPLRKTLKKYIKRTLAEQSRF